MACGILSLGHLFNSHLLSPSYVSGVGLGTEGKTQSLLSDKKDRNMNKSWNLWSTFYAPDTVLSLSCDTPQKQLYKGGVIIKPT